MQLTKFVCIPHSKPIIDDLEIQKIKECFLTGYLTNGQKLPLFEQKFLSYIGLKYGVGTSSGTDSLILALRALGVQSGDEVIIPVYVCDSVWHAVKSLGASPVIIDNETHSCNMSIQDILEKVTIKTKAIVIVHCMGFPFDVERLKNETKIPIIEDCSQSLGSFIESTHVGNEGDICIFSFNATKMITGGGGGFIASNKFSLIEKVKMMYNANDGKPNVYYKQNAIMNEIHASILLAQMEKLPKFILERKQIKLKYDMLFHNLNIPVYKHTINREFVGNNYRYLIYCNYGEHEEALKVMKDKGLEIKKPILPLDQYHKFNEKFPNCKTFYNHILSVPIYPTIKTTIDSF